MEGFDKEYKELKKLTGMETIIIDTIDNTKSEEEFKSELFEHER